MKKIIFFCIAVLIAGWTVKASPQKENIQASSLEVDSAFDLDSIGEDFSIAFDSLDQQEAQEDEFQQSNDSLFSMEPFDIDSFAWDNKKINTGKFDVKNWTDTARIALVDSSKWRFYVDPVFGSLTSNFGQRRWRWHYGVDIKLATGDTIRAAFDGIVRVIQFDRRGYGDVVVLRHHSGIETLYGHLSAICVQTNQRMRAGEVIGLGGSTGRSTGPHLHFESRYYGQPFDPNHLIDFKTGKLRSDTLVLTKKNFAYLVEVRKTLWHTVRKGDNLGKIARKYNTSIKTLCRLNRITVKTPLRIGRKLVVAGTPRSASVKTSVTKRKKGSRK